jgi:hypothetical protein
LCAVDPQLRQAAGTLDNSGGSAVRKRIQEVFLFVIQILFLYLQNNCLKKIMVHTSLIPNQTVVELALPNHYVGKKVEFLIYVSDEVERLESTKASNASQFKGILNAEEAKSFNQYLTSVRQEWDRNI